jgi:hypothetical protein
VAVLLSRQNKMMLLFISSDNPLFRRILALTGGSPREPGVADMERILKVSHQTLPNWRAGGGIDPDHALERFTRVLRYIDEHAKDAPKDEVADIKRRIERYRNAFADGTMEVDDAAELLGMTVTESHRIVDETINARWPLFPAMYYGTSDESTMEAKADLAAYGGVYLAWVYRKPLWLQCSMRVSYLIPVGDGQALRCKMNFPIIAPQSHEKREAADHGQTHPHWEYDGFLSVREQRLFLAFEKRRRKRNDYFYLITCPGKVIDRHQTMSGTYLTTGQDAAQSVVTGEVVLKRFFAMDGDENSDDRRALMENSPAVIPEGDERIALIEDIRKRYADAA